MKIVRVSESVAEIEVEMMETDEGWLSYLSMKDAYKLDDVRAALRSEFYMVTEVRCE